MGLTPSYEKELDDAPAGNFYNFQMICKIDGFHKHLITFTSWKFWLCSDDLMTFTNIDENFMVLDNDYYYVLT